MSLPASATEGHWEPFDPPYLRFPPAFHRHGGRVVVTSCERKEKRDAARQDDAPQAKSRAARAAGPSSDTDTEQQSVLTYD